MVAGPLLAALLLAGTLSPGSWGPGDGGYSRDPSDIVRAVVADGPLGVDSSERQTPELVGAHPVTRVGDSLEVRPAVARDSGTETADLDVSDLAVPARVLAAYRGATASIRRSDSTCSLTWPLLAGIGKVESGHAFGGAVDRTGLTLRPILGPVLDGGPGVAAITDSDGGRWDTDATWDRAVGPMQFIPTSWQVHGADGNGDGRDDPNNVADAALASGGYLCAGDRDLDVERHRRAAVFSYNHSWDYVDLVLAWTDAYAGGAPVLTGGLPGGPVQDSAGTGRPPACPECATSRRTTPDRRVVLTPTAGPVAVRSSTPGDLEDPAAPAAEPASSGEPSSAEASEPVVAAPAPTPPSDSGAAEPSPTPPACPTPAESPDPSQTPSPTGSASPSESPSPTASPEPEPTQTTLPSTSPTPTETAATPSPTATPTPGESCGPGSPG